MTRIIKITEQTFYEKKKKRKENSKFGCALSCHSATSSNLHVFVFHAVFSNPEESGHSMNF